MSGSAVTGSRFAFPEPCGAWTLTPMSPRPSSAVDEPLTSVTASLDDQEQADEERFKQQRAQLARMLEANPDLTKLCTTDDFGSLPAPPPTLQAAVSKAGAVVWGVVDDVDATSDGVFATLNVKRSSGLPQGSVVRIRLGYSIELRPSDPPMLMLAPMPGSSFLRAGDEVIILAAEFEGGGLLELVGGAFPIDHGVIHTADAYQRPFYPDADGVTGDAFFERFVAGR